jgi:PAS domain S-box-containing protein
VRNQTKQLKDITRRLKHTQEMLHVSEEKYRELVQNADCIILRMDTNGRITFLNEFAQKFFGYTEQEILGKKAVWTAATQKNRSGRGLARLIRDIKRHPELCTAYENENICRDGRRAWVAWANKPIYDERRDITEILSVGHDITERKLMENELQLLATAVHNSNDAIIVQDIEGNIISWNLGAERIYGYSVAEAIKMNVSRFVPDHKQDEMTSLVGRVLKGANIESSETQRLARDNRVLYISLTAALLKDEKGKPFAITTTERDITELRSLEKEILNITEKERELIGQEMHDGIGQLLTGIAFKCKGLALELKGKSAEAARDASIISGLASEAIAQVRNIARMLYPIDIETGGLVSALKKLASNVEKTMGVKCRLQCDKSVSVKNLVEAKQIYRIVQEAVTNALKHGKAKNISIKLRFTRRGTVLSVRNDGLAFPKLSPRREGLGLRIMKYRTDLIGGSLDIRKGDRGGTVVTCILPNRR